MIRSTHSKIENGIRSITLLPIHWRGVLPVPVPFDLLFPVCPVGVFENISVALSLHFISYYSLFSVVKARDLTTEHPENTEIGIVRDLFRRCLAYARQDKAGDFSNTPNLMV